MDGRSHARIFHLCVPEWRHDVAPIYSGFSFEVIEADLDVVFVGNDGADSAPGENSGLQSVTVTYPADPSYAMPPGVPP